MSLNEDPTYTELKSLAEKYPENTLLQLKLKYYRPYPPRGISNDDVLKCRVMYKMTYKLELIFAFFKMRKSAHSHSYVNFLS